MFQSPEGTLMPLYSSMYNNFGQFPLRYKYINILWFCAHWLAMSNSCYNPFIYLICHVSSQTNLGGQKCQNDLVSQIILSLRESLVLTTR